MVKHLLSAQGPGRHPGPEEKPQTLSNEGSALGIDLSSSAASRGLSANSMLPHILSEMRGLKLILLLRPVWSSPQHLPRAEITGMRRHTHLLHVLYEEHALDCADLSRYLKTL